MEETIMRKILATGLLVLAVAGLTGCGVKHAAEKAACAAKIVSWYEHKGGKGDIAAVRAQAEAAGKAAQAVEQGKADAASVAAAKKASAGLGSSITALKGNLPPDCAGGVNGDVAAGLGDYVQVSKHLGKAATASQAKDARAVQSEVKLIKGFVRAGDDEFGRAGRGVLKYLGS